MTSNKDKEEIEVIEGVVTVSEEGKTFVEQVQEMMDNAFGKSLQESDDDATNTWLNWVGFQIENIISTHYWFPFAFLWITFSEAVDT